MILMLGLLQINRIAFLIVNYAQFRAEPFREVLFAFLVGLRFDLATALITCAIPLLPAWIPMTARQRQFGVAAAAWLSGVVIVVAAIFLWGDIIFYGESNRHVTLEPFDMASEPGPLIQIAIDRYLPYLVVIILAVTAVGFAISRLFKLIRLKESALNGLQWNRLGWFLVVLMVTFVGGRGGLQKEPLKSADAVFGNSIALSNLALNGWYSFLTEAVKPRIPSRFMPDSLAIEETRKIVDPDGRFSSSDYPLLQHQKRSAASIALETEKLNVVLIIVESLNAAYLRSFGGSESVMPFLDSLAERSLILENFSAIGTRSFRGVTAILTSFPILSNDPYRLTFRLPQMRGLGLIFREQDYQTVFIHAAPDNSMGIAAICRIAGYERFLSQSDFPSGNYNGSWGVWDHVALERLTTEMDAAAEPFHYGIFSLCTHSPWSLPEGFRPRFESDHSDAEILNTFAYLDDALRAFFEREAARERFSRTVYVIVGDHTTHADEVERFHVGALFYAPGRIEPAVHHQISTQLDILPTIIDLTGIETAHSSFGSSLFSEQPAADWSAHFQSNMLQFREGDRMLVSDIRHTIALVDPSDPKLTGGGLMSSEPGITEELTFKLKSLFQTSEMLMQTNRIAPLIARSNVLSE